jgi:hypothetical protein
MRLQGFWERRSTERLRRHLLLLSSKKRFQLRPRLSSMLASAVQVQRRSQRRPGLNPNLKPSIISRNCDRIKAQKFHLDEGVPMAFSFADLGFWRLSVGALVFELIHALLESHWPGIRGSRLGPRPQTAVLFMFAEAAVVMLALAAAIGTIAKMLRLPVHPIGQISAVVVMALCLIVVFLLVWQS